MNSRPRFPLRQCLAFFAAIVSLHADYPVGSTAVPKPVIRTEATFQVYGGHPRLFFRDTDLPAIRARVAGDFKEKWDEMRATLASEVLDEPVGKFGQVPFLQCWRLPSNAAFVAAVLDAQSP